MMYNNWNYTRKPLSDHKYCQCSVRLYADNTIVFQSYATDVVMISAPDVDGFRWLSCSGTYSPTTRKQIGYFMREYTDESYALCKWCYENNMEYCLDTGEIREL